MRPLVIGIGLVLFLIVGSAVALSVMPVSPQTAHVEQRIPDDQIPR